MSRQGGRSPAAATAHIFPLTSLPHLPLDKVIHYLEAEDLRRFHQVSAGWRKALESRPKDNRRRLELNRRIQEDKENIARGGGGPVSRESLPSGVVALRAVREQRMLDMDPKKMAESPVLMECTNQFENTTPTSESSRGSLPDYGSSLTPVSRFVFQDFQEAEKILKPGEKLLQCRRCRGPVPSPVSSNDTGGGGSLRRSSSQRCKLVSKLNLQNDYDYQSPEKNVSKKAKTLSTVDLSPISHSPPVTVASLTEKMAQSLVLSSPCLTSVTTAGSHHILDQIGSSTPRVREDLKRSTSCSSINGIDLHPSMDGEHSSINLSLNFSNNSFEKSNPLAFSNIDLLYEKGGCVRSCCRVDNNMHNSQFSDSGFSHDSESNPCDIDFPHLIPSPVGVPVVITEFRSYSHNNLSEHSIERGRNNMESYSSGGGGFSRSSLHLQRSDQNLSVGNSVILPQGDNSLIPTVECPNPQCRFRFCSNCEECEHPERSCRLLSSDHIESLDENHSNNTRSSSYVSDGSRDSGTGKKNRPKHNKSHKKSNLKRLARL